MNRSAAMLAWNKLYMREPDIPTTPILTPRYHEVVTMQDLIKEIDDTILLFNGGKLGSDNHVDTIAISMDDLVPKRRRKRPVGQQALESQGEPIIDSQELSPTDISIRVIKEDTYTILQDDLHEITYHTFKHLLDALTVLLAYDNCHRNTETAAQIHMVWGQLMTSISRFLQDQARLPCDLVSVLNLSIALTESFKEAFDYLPKNDILRAYENLRYMDFNKEMRMKTLMQQLNLVR